MSGLVLTRRIGQRLMLGLPATHVLSVRAITARAAVVLIVPLLHGGPTVHQVSRGGSGVEALPGLILSLDTVYRANDVVERRVAQLRLQAIRARVPIWREELYDDVLAGVLGAAA
ncbi:hypothetical protein [Plasticicumulans acidivorans]|uniref:Uncharacterized protein n=1 Tax=Plasticicumulans acidivorans TaxID=886464 RepID=A0A317N0D1_9GAMM|nr:hypothetical protein [Plasticicumulans acidivorans]PWV66022.1 hypothetical protein C7443_101510 [Plasticicumulans acidivorans]